MRSSSREASARQISGEPSPAPAGCGDRNRNSTPAHLERELAELLHHSTQDLRLAWRQLHRAGPPLGISRDLLIRAIANQLQEHTYGGISRALRQRLQSLACEVEKGHTSFDSAVVVKPGTTLLRQWRGRVHTVLVRDDGFEYQGERYRSLTVIAQRITGAHWSGPRFFGLTKRAAVSVGAE
jgi:hypothetical protein